MQRDVAAQSRLADQLSDLSSILGGTLSLSVEEVDLVSLMGELGTDVQGQVSSPRVLADPGRLRQLLAILLPGPGPESPRPALIVESSRPGTLLIRGLARKRGPGLVGTTLARALAELQRGRLTVSPTTEGGTVFVVQLPAPDPGMER
jgi:signal transduction histidine kinase